MKRYGKIILLLGLAAMLLLPACEIPRPGGGGDIGDVQPPAVTPPPVTEAEPTITPIPGVTAEPVIPPEPGVTAEPAAPTGPDVLPPVPETPPPPDDLVVDIFTAPVEPVEEVVPGSVLLKLNEPAAIQALEAEPGPDSIVAAGIDSLDARLRAIGATSLEPVVGAVTAAGGEDVESFTIGEPEVGQIYALSFPPGNDPRQVAAEIAEDPAVEYAEPNFIAGITGGPGHAPAAFTPNDPYFPYQWNLGLVQMPSAWDLSTGEGAIVAIVDTGIDFRAPDLVNVRTLSGYDFANDDTDPTDDQGHGTHVAGTVAQTTHNNVGVAGVAFNAQLMPVKVLGSDGLGSYENIIQGIVYAVDQGAKVINLSLAGTAGSQALQDAVKYAYDRGVLVVAAAGNRSGAVSYPAAYDGYVMAIGAVRYDLTLAPYSNFGPQIDLMAPGGDTSVDQNGDGYADGIVQQTFRAVDGGYKYLFFEGTSMASPHVAGLAALLLSRQPGLTPAQLSEIMTGTARDLGDPTRYGAGLIQAADALARVTGPVTPTDTPTFTPGPPIITPTPMTPTPPPPITATPTWTPVPALITPTPTWTPLPPPITATPPPPPAGDLLTSGGFETDGGWVFGDTPIRGSYSTATVRSGSRAVCLGATSGPDRYSYSSVWQKVTVPAEASNVSLNAFVYPISQDTPAGGDRQYIMILNQNFRPIRILAEDLTNSQTWEQRTYNLSDLAGQTVYIYFSVLNQGCCGKLSAMCLDDVTLTWGK